ncbi:MAG: hypothetical protein ACK50Q_08080 [Labrys sp. (in: a-proteobacteria)]|jgi:hypothetical protein
MGHWSLSPPARGGAAIYKARPAVSVTKLAQQNDELRSLIAGGVLGGSASTDDFFKTVSDMSFAMTTVRSAGSIASARKANEPGSTVDVTA